MTNLHINDVLDRKPVPRIELHPGPEGWTVTLVNHRRDRRSGTGPQPKHDAIAFAKELREFLDWPLIKVTQ